MSNEELLEEKKAVHKYIVWFGSLLIVIFLILMFILLCMITEELSQEIIIAKVCFVILMVLFFPLLISTDIATRGIQEVKNEEERIQQKRKEKRENEHIAKIVEAKIKELKENNDL